MNLQTLLLAALITLLILAGLLALFPLERNRLTRPTITACAGPIELTPLAIVRQLTQRD
jgi:hypothetical protein